MKFFININSIHDIKDLTTLPALDGIIIKNNTINSFSLNGERMVDFVLEILHKIKIKNIPIIIPELFSLFEGNEDKIIKSIIEANEQVCFSVTPSYENIEIVHKYSQKGFLFNLYNCTNVMQAILFSKSLGCFISAEETHNNVFNIRNALDGYLSLESQIIATNITSVDNLNKLTKQSIDIASMDIKSYHSIFNAK